MNIRHWVLLLVTFALPQHAIGGAYIFADGNNLERVAHPRVYTGVGGTLSNLTICVDVSVNPDLAVQAEAAVIKAVKTFNRLRSIPNNTLAFNASTDIPSGRVDFESTLLHEMGHCQGLAHPNHATESGLAEPDRNGTKSSNGADGVFNQGAGLDVRHGSNDDVRGDDLNLHWYVRNQNNPGVLPAVFDGSTLIRALTALPAGHLFAANADRNVLAALGIASTEAVMQQGAGSNEAQRQLQADDETALRLARSGLDRIQGTADDYSFQLSYVGQLNNPTDSACNLRVRLDTSTSFAVCAVGGSGLNASNIRITTANLAFNSATNWYFTPGENTVTTISSDAPDPSNIGQPYTVAVTVREASGISISGEPRGSVIVSDNLAAPNSSSCTISLAGTVAEVGSCVLNASTSGVRTITAQYLGFGGWDASAATDTHQVNGTGFSVGGTLLGLRAGNSITLRLNGANDLVRSANGAFVFTPLLNNLASYSVSIATQPSTQRCVLRNASGTVSGANVADVLVECALFANGFEAAP